ncbi:hypothetical protein HKX48_008938 [Thoreauomyces humboldtii]|nr:hypothetical protein HKX48_008938 [Thoreauomyces humboldtii]
MSVAIDAVSRAPTAHTKKAALLSCHLPTTAKTANTTNVALAPTAAEEDTLYNWSGINPIAPRSQIHAPESEEQLAALIRASDGRINVVGSALSYEMIASLPAGDQSALLVDMRELKGLRSIDEEKGTAVFGPATTIDSVIRILGEHGRMLPCSPGVIGIQTLAGSISTGTHGQGLFQASYADIVESVRVVLPSGEVAIVGGPKGRPDLPLAAFVTSVGTLGVITEIEIRTAPRRVFSCTKLTCDLSDLLENYQRWNETVEFVKVWWFPETDQVHVWLTDPADPASAAYKEFVQSEGKTPVESAVASSALNDTVHLYCTAMSHDTKSSATSTTSSASPPPSPTLSATSSSSSPSISLPEPSSEIPQIAPQFRTVRRFADARDITGHQEQILTKGIPVPQVNCEIAVPLEHWSAATLALREWTMSNKGRLHYPFIYRATGQSSAWLNPAYDGPVVYIGLLVYLAADGTIRADGLETMRDVQVVLERFGGLPHWGKHFVPEIYDFGRGFARWDDFEELRSKVDPTSRFLSPWLGKVFAVGSDGRTVVARPARRQSAATVMPQVALAAHL